MAPESMEPMDVIEDGVTGYLFEAGNSADLANKMKMFVEPSVDEKAVMGKSGREKVEKEFDRRIVVEKYLAEII